MFPYFTLLGRDFYLYSLLALCGMFAVGLYACRAAKKSGYDDTGVIVLLLLAGVGVMLGGHLLYGLIHFSYIVRLFTDPNASSLFLRLGLIFGGSVYYGGLLGAIGAGTIYGRRKFGPALPGVSDIIAPTIPLFHFFGRIGCFMSGCCFGVESGFGFTFTRSIIPEANGINRFPVQLLEALFNISLFYVLHRFRKTGKYKGKLLYLYLLIYPAGRFLLECIRGDEFRGIWGPLSTSQWISLGLIIFSLFKLGRAKTVPSGGA
jgi:phosphatidylglycerol:prolipoprotein diacylglycerol transferase